MPIVQVAPPTPRSMTRDVRTGVLAGLFGGLAEVLWVGLFAPVAGADSSVVAREVTSTLLPALSGGATGVAVGLAIHIALSLALGVAIVVALRHAMPSRLGTAFEFALVTGLLALVWSLNFLVVLPAVNPAFVTMMPLWASFVSKLGFGVVAAAIVVWRR